MESVNFLAPRYSVCIDSITRFCITLWMSSGVRDQAFNSATDYMASSINRHNFFCIMLYGIVVTGMSRETFLCSIDAVNAFFSWDKQ